MIYRDDDLVAFPDINPQAPVHVLIVPTEHIPSLCELGEEHDAMIGKVHRVAARIAAERGVGASGFRVVANCGQDGGQSAGHVHFHLLGGRALGWPPG